MRPSKFQVSWPFGSGEEAKNSFFKMVAVAAILGFRIGNIVAIFDLQATPMLPTKFRVNWPFSVQEKKQKMATAAILDFRSERF